MSMKFLKTNIDKMRLTVALLTKSRNSPRGML